MVDPGAQEKERQLVAWLATRRRVAVGFSGGVDSSYLAAVAVEALGVEHTVAFVGRSDSLSGREEDHALTVARSIGIRVHEVETGELADPRYAANPADRCYFCKHTLWHTLAPLARASGFETLVDGTNADDLGDYRPGGRAAVEQGVLSPLAEMGLTKAEIRDRTKARGWPWWDRPASPCLASRLPYGTAVTRERLRQVETAESGLRDLGVTGNLRVRHYGDVARVELDRDVLAHYESGAAFDAVVRTVTAAGYLHVELDPLGFRSGSLNVLGVIESGAAIPRD